MASLAFEGECEELSTEQNQFIRDVLEKRGFIDNKVLFAPVGKVGDNYGANVKRITVEVENGDNFYMILKIAPQKGNIREMFMSDGLFNNEIVMYTKILPKLQSLQIAADVAKEDILTYAECYGCLSEKPHELILLEDLKPKNFTMLDRTQPLPDEAVKSILKNFATLHSLSYVLKKVEPEVYNEFKNSLFDLWAATNDKPENAMMGAKLESEIAALIDNEDHIKIVRGALTGSIAANKRIMNRDKDSKYSVIVQGDGWTNNIMFQIPDGVIAKSIMIDYQISREANPICDVLYMIYLCTDYKSRIQHFYDWLNYYHEQLDRSLSNFGIRASMVYPKDLLDADARRYSKVYLGTAIFILNFLLRGTEEAAEMKNAMTDDYEKVADSMAVSTLSSETTYLYKTRIEELITSLQELGLL